MSRLSPPRSVVAGAVAYTLAVLLRAPASRAQEDRHGISSEEASLWSFQVVPSISLRGARGRFVRDAKATSTWVDPFVGGRFAVPLVGDLDLLFRGDIGGFGAGSQLAWNLIGGFQVLLPWQPWGARTSLIAVYKALDFDYESGSSDAIDVALDLRGPALGLAFEF